MHNILGHLPTQRQTLLAELVLPNGLFHVLEACRIAEQRLLFSATLHSSVHRLSRAALRSPEASFLNQCFNWPKFKRQLSRACAELVRRRQDDLLRSCLQLSAAAPLCSRGGFRAPRREKPHTRNPEAGVSARAARDFQREERHA